MDYLATFEYFRNEFQQKLFIDGEYNFRKWKCYPDFKKLLKNTDFNEYHDIKEKILALRLNLPVRPKCVVCGNITSINGTSDGFRDTCSVKCAANSPAVKTKTANTCKEKYGGHFMQNAEFKAKFVETQKQNNSYQKGVNTLEKRYGVRSVFALDTVKKAIKDTNIGKYGTENAMQNTDVKAKMKSSTIEKHGGFFNPSKTKQTLLEKYGVDNPLKSDFIKQQVKNTVVKKYGGFFNPSKTKQTLLEKYGVDKVSDITGIFEKSKIKFKQTIYNRIISKLADTVQPLFTQGEYLDSDTSYKWRCVKCSDIFTSILSDGKIPRCFKCYPISRTGLETEIKTFIEDRYNLKSVKNRTILNGKELDLYFEELKIAIEINGVYWHSDEFKDKNYHQKKSLECLDMDIKLIHIFEDDWFNNKIKIVSLLDSIFGVNKRIFARHCIVVKISQKCGKEFIDRYHLSSDCLGAKVYYGLIHNNEIISVMSFGKPRYNKSYEWEIFRYCTISGITIVGGASKILNLFERELLPKSLLSYASLDYSAGGVYEKCGFILTGITAPSYFYIDTNGKKFKRLAATKNILNKLAGTDDLSEYEAAIKLKLLKVFNAGNLVFVKSYN